MEVKMKRLLAVILIMTMVLSMAACSSSDKSKDNKGSDKKTEEDSGKKDSGINIVDKPTDPDPYEPDDPDDPDPADIPDIFGVWTGVEYPIKIQLNRDLTYVYYAQDGEDGEYYEYGSFSYQGNELTFEAEAGYDQQAPTLHFDSDDWIFYNMDGHEFFLVEGATTIDDIPDGPDEPDDPEPVDSPETVGYFNYYNIRANTGAGSRFIGANTGFFKQSEGDGYCLASPSYEVVCTEYSPDDGNGFGHAKFELTVWFGYDAPSEYKTVNVGWCGELYDTFAGQIISPDTSTESPDRRWTNDIFSIRPEGTYEVKVTFESRTEAKTGDYFIIFHDTYNVIFTTGYSGVDLVLYPAPKNNKTYKKFRGADRMDIKIKDDPYVDIENSYIVPLM